MDLKLVKETDMPLMGRKRLTYNSVFDSSTPSKSEFKNQIAKDRKVDPSLVVVRHVYQRFGSRNTKVIANVYQKKEMIDLYEEKLDSVKSADKKEAKEKKEEAEKKE